eukprot:761139-Hanusia_phi.AAC.2
MDDLRLRRVEEANSLHDVKEDADEHVEVQLDGLVVDKGVEGAQVHVLEHDERVHLRLDHRTHDRDHAGVAEAREDAHLLDQVLPDLLPQRRELAGPPHRQLRPIGILLPIDHLHRPGSCRRVLVHEERQ